MKKDKKTVSVPKNSLETLKKDMKKAHRDVFFPNQPKKAQKADKMLADLLKSFR